MKKLAMTIGLLTVIAFGAGGCVTSNPTYEAVGVEAVASLEEIAALVPEPKTVVREPEGEPYPCGDKLLLTSSKGAFFTGQWAIYPPENFNRAEFISSLPTLLGSSWEKRPLSVEVSFASTYLVHKETNVQVSVDEIEIEGRKAIDLIAISRCGTLPKTTSTEPGGFLVE